MPPKIAHEKHENREKRIKKLSLKIDRKMDTSHVKNYLSERKL